MKNEEMDPEVLLFLNETKAFLQRSIAIQQAIRRDEITLWKARLLELSLRRVLILLLCLCILFYLYAMYCIDN